MLRKLGYVVLTTVILFGVVVLGYLAPYFSRIETEPAQLVVNDVTQLNPVVVARVFNAETESGLIQQLVSSQGNVSIGGGRFSQGGQTAAANSLHIDMRSYNKVLSFDQQSKQITVQAGIRWRDLQAYIDSYNLSVKIMQSYADFTVGGSLSVNAHGRYVGEGPIINSVLAIRVLLANGDVLTATPEQNSELYYAAIGGYGGVGIILEATLQLTDNSRVQRVTTEMRLTDYRQYFNQQVRNNPQIVFHNAVLYPPSYQDLTAVSWVTTTMIPTVESRLHKPGTAYWWQPALTDFVADFAFAKWIRQHWLDPILYSRNAVHWRNYEASYDVMELEPYSREKHTYGLREYFVPVTAVTDFATDLANILQRSDANILNVSIRHALPDAGSILAWAPEEVFAFVVYYRQGTDKLAQQHTDLWSQQLIDAVLQHGGSYYLPYQLSATPEQFAKAYPRAPEFFRLKQRYDPLNRFSSQFWQKYQPNQNNSAGTL